MHCTFVTHTGVTHYLWRWELQTYHTVPCQTPWGINGKKLLCKILQSQSHDSPLKSYAPRLDVWFIYFFEPWHRITSLSHLIPRPTCSKTLDRDTSLAWKGFLFSLNSCARQILQPSSGTACPPSWETYRLISSAVDLSPHSAAMLTGKPVTEGV